MIKQAFICFDDMTWPLPGDLAWTLIWGNPTKEELLKAASVIEAYKALILKTQKDRNYIAQKIKGVM